jgi:hypothetical protein
MKFANDFGTSVKKMVGTRHLLRNSAALVALSIFVGPLVPQAALADCSVVGVNFTCTDNDTDGVSVTITNGTTNSVGILDPGATITNTNGNVPLFVTFANISARSFTLTGSDPNNEIQSSNADAFVVVNAGFGNTTTTVNYAGQLDALNGNAFRYSSSLSTGGTSTANITFQQGSLVTASGTSDFLGEGFPTTGGGVVMVDINTAGTNAWTVTNHGTFHTRNDAISMYSFDNGTYVINNDGTLGTQLNPLGGSGAVIVGTSSNANGTVNNNDGDIWATGNGGLGGVFGGVAVTVGGNALVTSVDGDIHTIYDPGIVAIGGKSATVDSQGGLVESTNGSGILAATLGTGNTLVDSGEVNAGADAFAGLSIPAVPLPGGGSLSFSVSGGVIGYANDGNATVNTHGDISVATGGQFGAAAISRGGAATLDLNGVTIDPPLIGGSAIVIGGVLDATITTDGANVSADQIGLLGVNTGSGKVIINNNDDGVVNSAGAGVVALKLGAGDSLGGDSVQITNTGDFIGANGPGVAVIALDTTSTFANNVKIVNTGDALIRGTGDDLLSPGIGIIADGKVNITNTLNSTIDTTGLAAGLAMGIGAGGDIDITNDLGSDILGTALIGSTGGSVEFNNNNGSDWTFTGISVLGALGTDQDVTVKNSNGSTISINAGVLSTLADRDAIINNTSVDLLAPRSSITFSGVSANLMVAGQDTIINNNRSDFEFDGDFTGNFMIAGRDAVIRNQNEGFFSFTSPVNGDFMFADRDALIENTGGSTMLFAGFANGVYMNADRDARITNDNSSFTMLGLVQGIAMVAERDAEIINDNGGVFTLVGGLNSQIMIADSDGLVDGLDASGGDARIINRGGSTMSFIDILNLGTMSGDVEASFTNDATSTMNFIGSANVFTLSAQNTFFDNYGVVNITGGLTETGVTAFFGLDNFNNFGTINMVDDDPEEYLFLSGNYNAGSDWHFDAELTPGGEADLMNVRGNVTGVTHLTVIDLDGGPGQYDPEGVLFAMVGGDTDTSNFTTNGGIDKGLFRYDAYLRVDDPNLFPGDDGWYLASTLDQEGYEFPHMMSGAQALWNATTGTWLDRTADLRVALGEGGVDPNCAKDCLAQQGNVTPGVWMKALVGTQSRDAENRSSPPPGMLGNSYDYDNSFDQDFWGFLIGADGGKEWTTDSGHNAAWLVGLMGGYVGSNLDFSESNTDVDYEAFSIGVYTTFLHGGFFVDGTLKADIGTMDYDSDLGGGFSDDFSSDFTSVGGIIDMGYRFGMGSTAFFEPLASLSYVKTSIDDGEVLGTDINFEDGESLQGRLGARLGASFGDSMKSELFIEASAWNEFMGEYDAHLGSNGYTVDTDADTSGLYGEVAAGANVFGADGKWNGFLTGAVQFGDDFIGYSGNAGLRYNW